MEDKNMKKIYMTPRMEMFSYNTRNAILTTSTLDAVNWNGGGSGGARVFDNDEMDILMGGDIENILF